jgi:hypothetical protein
MRLKLRVETLKGRSDGNMKEVGWGIGGCELNFPGPGYGSVAGRLCKYGEKLP